MKHIILLLALFTLSSCSGPGQIQEATETTLEDLDELGQPRKVGPDIEITPKEEDKIKIRF